MIPMKEINENGRKYSVPISTIERDYVQNWLLKNLSGIDKMVLKGGTGIRKAYFANYRFSDDLDFTLIEKKDINDLRNRLQEAVDECKRESKISFAEELKINENVNGFRIDIYFRISQKETNRTKIKLDITKPEHETIILPAKNQKIIQHYSDHFDAKVDVYALEEIFAEKIRSIFQRTRPRDLYDLWYLWNETDTKMAFEILPDKFSTKKIKPDMDDLNRRKNDFGKAWENSLRHQLKELPDFDEVFEAILRRVKNQLADNTLG